MLTASGLASRRPLWLVVLVEAAAGAVSVLGGRCYRIRPSSPTVHIRMAAQAAAITATIYIVGWGPALAIVYVFAIVNNAFRIGSRSRWALVVWPVLTLALGQAVANMAMVPMRLAPATADGVAAVAGVALVFVALFVAQLVASKETAERKLAHAASHDPLTGLMNRSAFSRAMSQRLARPIPKKRRPRSNIVRPGAHAAPGTANGQRRPRLQVGAGTASLGRRPTTVAGDRRRREPPRYPPVAVLFGDLVGFKHVNDRFGHEAGDMVLSQVAARLTSSLRQGDLLARFAGDEFVVGLCPVISARDAVGAAERVLAVFEEPFLIGRETVRLGISVGIVFSPTGRVDVEALLAQADAAMYQAKIQHRSAWALLQVA